MLASVGLESAQVQQAASVVVPRSCLVSERICFLAVVPGK